MDPSSVPLSRTHRVNPTHMAPRLIVPPVIGDQPPPLYSSGSPGTSSDLESGLGTPVLCWAVPRPPTPPSSPPPVLVR